MQYLTSEDVVAVYQDAIGTPEIRYFDGLQSAVGRPQQSAFGGDAYPTLPLKAAALLQSLAENQPFVDGNKRIAWICAKLFLQINGATIQASDREGLELMVSGVANRMPIEQIADWIAARLSTFGDFVPEEYG